MGSWTEGALRSVAGHALQMRRWNRSRASVQRIRRPAARLAHEVGPLGVFVDFGAVKDGLARPAPDPRGGSRPCAPAREARIGRPKLWPVMAIIAAIYS